MRQMLSKTRQAKRDVAWKRPLNNSYFLLIFIFALIKSKSNLSFSVSPWAIPSLHALVYSILFKFALSCSSFNVLPGSTINIINITWYVSEQMYLLTHSWSIPLRQRSRHPIGYNLSHNYYCLYYIIKSYVMTILSKGHYIVSISMAKKANRIQSPVRNINVYINQ